MLKKIAFQNYYSKEGLWTLFLIAAFPTHVWTIILALRDFSWVAERTNAWDAFGVGAYGLLIAFVESLFVFGIALLFGFLIPKRWDAGNRLEILCALVLIVAGWAILSQLYFLLGGPVPRVVMDFLTGSSHPLRVLYGVSLALALATVMIPVYALLQSEKTRRAMRGLIDRLSLLTTLYLFLDLAALIIVVIRNL